MKLCLIPEVGFGSATYRNPRGYLLGGQRRWWGVAIASCAKFNLGVTCRKEGGFFDMEMWK